MRIVLKLLACILALLCMAGCGNERTHITVENNEKDVAVLAAYRHLAPGEKDGFYCSRILGVWEPLITHNEKGEPVGKLATGWQMEDEGKVWTFYLRQGVKFHNGTDFNADSVIKNFDRMKLGYKKSSFYGLAIDTYYPSLKKYEKLDDYTVRLTFGQANVNQLYKMMDFGSPMYAPECFTKDGYYNGFAIGTGPYKIKENALNKYVRLEKFDDYWGEKAHIKEFVIKSIPSPEVRYAALKAGEILGVLDLNAIPPFLADEVKKDSRFAISVNKSTMTRFLNLNGTRAPFNDVRMRKAVSLMINRDLLVNSLYLGYAYPTQNLLNYTSPYFVPMPVEYNVAKAKALAKEALGDKRVKAIYCINGSDPLQKGEAELIAYWLHDIGVDVQIMALEYGTMNKMMRKGEYDIARTQQGLPNGDPYSIFYTFMMPDGARNVSSSTHYKNDEVIALMDEAKHCLDEKRRKEIFARIQAISIEEQPIVPLFNDKSIVAYNKKLKNYDALIYGVDLAKVEWAK